METYNYFNSRLAIGNMQSYIMDKAKSAKTLLDYNLIRLSKLFKISGLPDTIPKEFYDRYLFLHGTCFLTEVNNDLYIFEGSFGGEPDVYYRPTLYIVANPALRFYKSLDINNDGVLLRNDPLWMGLFPMLARYSTLMAENLLTLRVADIMLRTPAYLSAPDDKTHLSAMEYLHDLEEGKLGVIGENRFFEGIKLQSPPSSNGSYLTQFIELHQYYIGSFYNEIGLESSFNMKHEQLNDDEIALNDDILLPLIDSMLQVRQEDFDKVNSKYGTNIQIDFDSSWKNNLKEWQMELQALASQLSGSNNNDSIGTNGTTTDGNGDGEEQFELNSNNTDSDSTHEPEQSGNNSDPSRDGEQNEPNDGGKVESADTGLEQGQSSDVEKIGVNINITNVNVGEGEADDGNTGNVQIVIENDGDDEQASGEPSRLSTDDKSDGDNEL